MNFFSFLNKKNRWSRETFGPGYRTERVIEHIEKEIEEIKKAPDDLSEWCDLILLATDGAYRRGYTSYQICCELERNSQQQWIKAKVVELMAEDKKAAGKVTSE